MAPRWEPSADKHGVARADQVHAILHATYVAELGASNDGGTVRLYVGPERLGPKIRRYREEHPHGEEG